MEYTNPFPIILLAVFLQSHLFVCNSKENIQILVANDIPVLFEDIPMLLLCHIPEHSIHATFSWFKDNVEIAECSSDAGATREIQLPPNVTLKHFEDITSGTFCSLEFNNLSIVDHRGLYTCFSEVGNSSRQEEFNLDILERKPFCTAKKQGPQEYLAGDRADFMCHNPYYSPRREIQLSIGEFGLENLRNITRQFKSDVVTFVISGTTTLDGRHNGSMFNCAAEQVQEDVAANQTTNTTEYSCSLGPIYIYESSFLLIEEVSEDDCPETMTIRCRVVPAQEEAEINWRIPEDVDDYTIEESGLYSMFKFPANSIDDEEEVVCYTSLANQNLSKSYQLRRFGGCTNPDDEDDGTSMLPFIISVAVVGGIAGTVVFIFILIVIYKCCCGKVGRQRHKPPPSTSNAAKGDIISDNESNMYPRYQTEPSALYLRPAEEGYHTPAGERYDIPPAGDVNHTPAEEFYDTSTGGEDDHTPAGENYENSPGGDVDHQSADEDYDTPPVGEDQHTPAGEEDYDTVDREDEAHDYDFPPIGMANLAMGLADYQV